MCPLARGRKAIDYLAWRSFRHARGNRACSSPNTDGRSNRLHRVTHPQAMRIARRDAQRIVRGVGALAPPHLEIAVVAHIAELRRHFDPRIPHHGGAAAAFGDADAARITRVLDHAIGRGVEIDEIGLPVEGHSTALALASDALDHVEVVGAREYQYLD